MEAFVHMTGYVGTEVEVRNGNGAGGQLPAGLHAADPRGGEWVDGATTWMTVTCFRALAEHALASVKKGDPVVVVGKLRTNVWTRRTARSSSGCTSRPTSSVTT